MLPIPFLGPLYAALFWSTYVLWFVLETISSRKRRSGDKSRAQDRGSYPFLMGCLWTALGAAFALSAVVPKAAIRWERVPLFYAGIALMLAGLAFRFYAMSLLGRFFTYDVTVQTGQTVIESGPYRYVRHPSYTGALMTLLGLGLALGNWAGLAALLGCTAVGYGYRISVEEAALLSSLGEPYKQYMSRTRRFIPFLF